MRSDGDTFDMFLDAVGGHKRCNINYDASHFIKQCMDYVGFIDAYHDRIKMFHVKDAEFNPTGRQGVYGGYQSWLDRAGRFRSLGDGQVNFKSIFSKLAGLRLQRLGRSRMGMLPQTPGGPGAREGAPFIRRASSSRSTDYRVRRFRRDRRRQGRGNLALRLGLRA